MTALSGLVGCASPYNDRSTLGRDDVTIEAIADPGPVYGPIVDDEDVIAVSVPPPVRDDLWTTGVEIAGIAPVELLA